MAFKTRLRAAGIHLGISMGVAALAAALVLVVWYPAPFRDISGGRELFFLVVSVDLVLGPLITLTIFDQRKPFKELRRDLAVVALLQLAGLAYGLFTVWGARPVHLVFEVDRFRVVRAIDVDPAELVEAHEAYRTLPWWGPDIIMAQPKDTGSSDDLMKSVAMAMEGRDIYVQPATWRPYVEAKESVLRRAKPLSLLLAQQPAHRPEIEAAAQAAARPVERISYLPILGRQTHWAALVDNQTAQVVGYLPFGGFD